MSDPSLGLRELELQECMSSESKIGSKGWGCRKLLLDPGPLYTVAPESRRIHSDRRSFIYLSNKYLLSLWYARYHFRVSVYFREQKSQDPLL